MEGSDTAFAGKKINAMTAFRDTFKGYNKEDVNAYLEDMNIRFASVEDDYKKIIYSQKQTIEGMQFKIDEHDHLYAELAQLKEKLTEKDNRLEANKNKFEEYEKLLTVLNSKTQQYAADFESLTDKLSTANAENSILIDENADLNKEKQTFKNKLAEQETRIGRLNAVLEGLKLRSEKERVEAIKRPEQQELEEKARLYDSMSTKLGNLVIIANNNSDRLVADASTKAASIIAEAKQEADNILSCAEVEREHMREEGRKKLEAMLSSANSKLFSMSEEYIKNYTEYLRRVKNEFDQLIDGLKVKSGEIKSKVDDIRVIVSNELELEFSRIIKDLNSENTENVTPESFGSSQNAAGADRV